ncbi:uncharacterized protein V1518DRAFT_409128 [Limtongia smithiae]|uniref:uncharacterized protein n=1 Tax=Limtongia smithiae TaxID=1125753 RepID=UPI0034CD0A3D
MYTGTDNQHIVSAKDKKYDRQLRLWAANGQTALENAHVLLLSATAVGAEILKNLVLPGVGAFTIVDDKLVSQEDIDSNFFVISDSLGKPRAESVSSYLQELNADSTAHSLSVEDINALTEMSLPWEEYTLVVANGLLPSTLKRIANFLWQKDIPLIVTRSVGFYASLRIVVKEHAIFETHPDAAAIVDLRLDCPWPELRKFADGFDLETLEDIEHSHIPFVILLLLYLKKWREEHDNCDPETREEKQEFKKHIQNGVRTSDPENFDEAANAVWRTQKTVVPDNVLQILNDPRANDLTSASDSFWIIAHAVADFVASEEGDGLLPLSGTVPDMKADTQTYVALQSIYRAKAVKDRSIVLKRVRELESSLGRSEENAITEGEVEAFCKFSRFLVVQDGRSIEQEYTLATAKSDTIIQALTEPFLDEESEEPPQSAGSLMAVYIAMRAADEFAEQYGRYAGSLDEEYETDIGKIETIAANIMSSLGGTTTSYLYKALHEIVRYGGGELHNISSLLGGITAQEIIKLLTRQYVPMVNTMVFDGIQSRSEVWEL